MGLKKSLKLSKSKKIYRENLELLKKQQKESTVAFPFGKSYPCLEDRFLQSGIACGHYFHQDLLVASRVFERQPTKHVDVGSSVEGFVAHVATFRKVHVLDVRKLESKVKNIDFHQCDMMETLPEELIDWCDSLSCLHALEHFGLGRYGDPVCYEGHLKGFSNLSKILKAGGTLYLSVPIGPQRIEFDAHRVFSLSYLVDLVNEMFDILCFSFVDDAGDLFEDVSLNDGLKDNFGCDYGCGIFELVKK